MNLRRPNEGEYNPYYQHYIDQVKGNDLLTALKKGKEQTVSFLEKMPLEKWDFRYAPEKWSIKEVVLHFIDTERVFGYRAMRIARKDKTPLARFDENEYAPNSNASNRTPASLIEEYKALRNSTIQLFQHFTSEQLDALGTASDAPVSALALGFITAGHEVHHLKIIEERYL